MRMIRSRQCEGCGRTTAVRWLSGPGRWLCAGCEHAYGSGTATSRLAGQR